MTYQMLTDLDDSIVLLKSLLVPDDLRPELRTRFQAQLDKAHEERRKLLDHMSARQS